MPQPTVSDVHVNMPLTNVSIAWLQDQDADYVADKMFPVLPVKKQSDRYYTYDRQPWFQAHSQKRAAGAESAGSGYTLNATPTYYCDKYALHHDIDDDIRANADDVLNPDREATIFVTRDLVLRRELTWAAKYFTTGVWTGSSSGGDVTPSTLWDTTGSTPIEDMRAQFLATKKRTGYRANAMALGEEVWNVLQDHPDFTDRIKYTEKAIVTQDLVASLLGISKVLVAGGIQDTAHEGAAESMAFIVGKSVLIVYSAPSPGIMTPTAGFTFAWTGLFGANAVGGRIKRFRMEALSSDRIEGEMAYDQKLVAAEMGAFLSGVIS